MAEPVTDPLAPISEAMVIDQEMEPSTLVSGGQSH